MTVTETTHHIITFATSRAPTGTQVSLQNGVRKQPQELMLLEKMPQLETDDEVKSMLGGQPSSFSVEFQ